MPLLSSQQASLLNNLLPSLRTANVSLGDILNNLYNELTGGALGISADPADVDALALGGGFFTVDADSTSGMNLYWKNSRIFTGLALVTVPAGHVTLNSSATNYVEVDRAGSVTSNTTGFTSGRLPLWIVVTGVSQISTITSAKPLLQLLGSRGVPGAMLSAAGATKEITLRLGDVSATGTFLVPLPNIAGTIAGVRLATPTAIAASDTDYWQMTCQNKGASGAGTTDVLDTGAVNSTKVTGGAAVSSYVARSLALHATPANLVTAAKDVLALTFTKTGSATTMTNVSVIVEMTFDG